MSDKVILTPNVPEEPEKLTDDPTLPRIQELSARLALTGFKRLKNCPKGMTNLALNQARAADPMFLFFEPIRIMGFTLTTEEHRWHFAQIGVAYNAKDEFVAAGLRTYDLINKPNTRPTMQELLSESRLVVTDELNALNEWARIMVQQCHDL